jgi:hypothetical protein
MHLLRRAIAIAAPLIEALATKRPRELAAAWNEAWAIGPRWREKLEAGRAGLRTAAREALNAAVERVGSPCKR